jgi:hypothetical protein
MALMDSAMRFVSEVDLIPGTNVGGEEVRYQHSAPLTQDTGGPFAFPLHLENLRLTNGCRRSGPRFNSRFHACNGA